jgi:hypothetical protein
MRKRFFFTAFLLFQIILLAAGNDKSAGGEGKSHTGDRDSRLQKTSTITRPFWTPNRIGVYITNNGQLVSHIPRGNNAGMEWPRGSSNYINFASGIWVAGIKNGEIVTASGEFNTEFQPGPIIGYAPGQAGTAADARDPRYRLYIINQADALDPSSHPDYLEWPAQDGAPVNPDGTPEVLGTSTAWGVYNDFDPVLHDRHLKSKPMGIEIQQTAWAYDRPDAFGDMLFFKFKIINKSGVNIDSAFVSFWADVDIGLAQDLVGCDTTLSLGYVYKTIADGQYGAVSPAIGYDFFQGPIVPSPGDTALVSGKRVPGFRNLKMSSFAKYINAGPPQYSDPDVAAEAYSFMNGFDKVGDPIIDPTTSQPTKFWHAGDPVAGTGWLDDTHNDKRLLMSAGPFTLADGDTQEVVGGIIIAQGTDAASTINLLKENDALAQRAYDNNFALPPNPPSPQVRSSVERDAILLQWDDAAEAYEAVDNINLDPDGNPTTYTFQGYNVYQIDAATLGQGATVKKIATFDLIDGVRDFKDFVFLEGVGQGALITTQNGKDSGVQHHLRITLDEIRGKTPLIPDRKYYFTVTAYGYNPLGFPKGLESPIAPLTIIPGNQPLGTGLTSASGEAVPVSYSTTNIVPSEGSASIMVMDPAALTGHDYTITFRTDDHGQVIWDMTDVTAGNKEVVSGWPNQGLVDPLNFPIADGMFIKVLGPPVAVKSSAYIENGVEDDDKRWFGGLNNLVVGPAFFGSSITPDKYVEVEVRFRANADGQRAYTYLRGGTPSYQFIGYEPQHFTVWDVTSKPERQLNVAIVEQNGQQGTPLLWEVTASSSDRNYLFILNSNYSGDTPDPYYTSRLIFAQAAEFDILYAWWPLLRGGVTAPRWQDGQVLKITPYFGNRPNDIYSFKSIAPVKNNLALAKQQALRVGVFPNPYRGFNLEERDPVNRFVTFTNLTPTAKIRIYTLSGELVQVIEHNDGTTRARWNLRNSADVPVASGIYIVHVELPEIGRRVLKVAVFQPEERLDVF